MSHYRSNWSFHIPRKIYLRHLTICWARGYSRYVGLCSLRSRLRKKGGDWYWREKGNEFGERRSPFPALFALFSLSPCPSSVLRPPGRLWATWVCAAQQGMVFAPLALKERMKITLLSLLSLPKNRWHYWGSFSARLLFFLWVSSSRFTIDVRGRVATSKRNKPRASKTRRHTPIVNFSEYPSPFPPTPHCYAGWSSKSVHDLEIWIGKGRENKRGWLDSQLSFSDGVKYGD